MKIIEKIIDGCSEVKKNPDIHKDAKTLATLVIKDCNDALDVFQKLTDSAELNSVPNGWVKKKEWVGLTDEEILQTAQKRHARINNNIGNDLLLISFYKAVEAKLKEKNDR
jgi:hypothetical protein